MNRQKIVFKVGREDFAIDILLTKEIVVMSEITPVPETEEYVEGIMNLRGNLIPVLDLRKRLRTAAVSELNEQRIIIANFDGRLVGLIVDGATEVIRVSEAMIEPPPDVIAEMGIGYIIGVVKHKDAFITLIDLQKVLTEEILVGLDEVMELIAVRTETAA
ncbi:MAG: purine-binding chemotaxis protein CheW [Acidobacteria bacterium]|nr:purine-binding chemotaxis protein CheW [Acidobacteriota bacterium]